MLGIVKDIAHAVDYAKGWSKNLSFMTTVVDDLSPRKRYDFVFFKPFDSNKGGTWGQHPRVTVSELIKFVESMQGYIFMVAEAKR